MSAIEQSVLEVKNLRPITNERGFTLIEILVAFVIMTIVAVPLSLLLFQGYQLSNNAEQKITALYLAQEKMEEIMSTGLSQEELVEVLQTEIEGFKCTVTCSPFENLTLVTVLITNDIDSTQQVTSLSSILNETD